MSAAVGFVARTDAEDTHRYAIQVEADTMIPGAEAIFGRVDGREPLGVAAAGGGEPFDALIDAASGAFVERGHIGKGRLRPLDLPH